MINGQLLDGNAVSMQVNLAQFKVGRNLIEVQALDNGSPPEYSNLFSTEVNVAPVADSDDDDDEWFGGIPFATLSGLLLIGLNRRNRRRSTPNLRHNV